jgi:serine phosphatase RsbU (regulator of sigma subunit)/pSer/pThr/pTyr-binding forkhead associated (FHA) protein
MPTLLILTGAREGQRLPLKGDRVVLGRDAGCDIVLDETMVPYAPAGHSDVRISRKHAVISHVGGRYYIEDGDGQGARSRNGTSVNDLRLPFPGRTLLHHNDRIRICDFVCTFHDRAAVQPLPDHLRRRGPELTQDAGSDSSSVKAAIKLDSSSFLQTQPAERLKVILETSNSLSKTLDLDALLPQIVESLFRLFRQADRGFLILADEASGRLVPSVFKARQAAGAADDRFSTSIVRQCLADVQAVLGNDVIEKFPDSSSVLGLPVRSLMCAPLWSHDGRALGAIQLDTQHPGRAFTPDDLNLLLGVASQASIALSNARLHRESLLNQRRERDLEVARQVQRALLPRQLPHVPGYAFYAHYEPAREIGGDYYDFIPLPGGRLAVLLGDTAGKGVAAALVMVKFSVEARVCLLTEPDLAAAVSKLNAVMSRADLAGRFVTLAAVVLDPATQTATLVNAGHPSPLLCQHATRAVEEAAPVEVAGLPVGIADGQDYACCQVQLNPGDRLVLFSDGITEAMDAQDHQFGKKGTHAVLGGAGGTPEEVGVLLIEAVKQHARGCRQQDDITVVCLGRVAG